MRAGSGSMRRPATARLFGTPDRFGGGDGGIPMGGFVKLGGASDGGEVGLQRQCPVHAVFGGKSEHVAVLGIVGMPFGQFGEFVGGGLQVARIEGQVGLVV